jgi:hypothetical protein
MCTFPFYIYKQNKKSIPINLTPLPNYVLIILQFYPSKALCGGGGGFCFYFLTRRNN